MNYYMIISEKSALYKLLQSAQFTLHSNETV